jgi:phage-related protein
VAEDITLGILLKIKESVESLNTLQAKSQQTFDNIASSAKRSNENRERSAKKSNDIIAKSFNAVKVAAAAAIAVFSTRAIAGFFDEAIKAAAEEQQAIQNLNSALQATGRISEEVSKDLIEFADTIEKSTTFTGEQVLATEAYLASLTKLNTEGLKSATQAAVDLAATLNVDLQTATKLITKGINGNVSAFNRYNIEVKQGSTQSENLANVLKALSSQQGNAAKQSNTFRGAIIQLGNSYDDLSKAVGSIIVDNKEFVALIKIIAQAIGSFAGSFKDASSPLSNFVSEMSIVTLNLLPSFITILTATAGTINVFIAGFTGLAAVVAGATSVLVTLTTFLVQNWINIFADSAASVFELQRSLLSLTGIGSEEKLLALDERIKGLRSTIVDTSKTLGSDPLGIGKVASGFARATVGVVELNDAIISGGARSFVAVKQSQNSFDDIRKSIGKVGAAAIVSGDDVTESNEKAADSTKDLNSAYSKFNTTFQSLTSEVEKQGKSKQELADIEFRNSSELAAATAIELANQGKLTKEIAEQIAAFQKLGEAKRDAAQSGSEASGSSSVGTEKSEKKENIFGGEQLAAVGLAIESAFSASVDLVQSGISQAFALGSAVLNGQIFTELDNALKATILAPVEALGSLRELSGTFDALKGESSLSRTFDALISELPKFVDNFVSRFPALADTFVAKFPEFIARLADAIPIVIDQLVAAFPAIVSSLADGFDVIIEKLVAAAPGIVDALVKSLPRIIASLLDGLTKIIESAPEIFEKILEGLPAIITSILSRVPQLITALAKAIPQLIRVLASNLAPIFIAIIDELPAIVQALVENFIPLIPQIVLALVDELIVKGGIVKIVFALIKSIPQIALALINGLANGVASLGASFGSSAFSSFEALLTNLKLPELKAPKIPKVEIAKLDFKVPDNIRDLFNGKAFVSRVSEAFNNFINEFKKALTPGKGGFLAQVSGAASRGGGAVEQFVNNAGGLIRAARGGTVPNKPVYANQGFFKPRGTDTVPAMLTPGEMVIPRDDVNRLSNFLDGVESGSGSVGNLEAVLSRLERSSAKQVTVNVQVGEKQLAQVLLDLGRQGFRTA